MRELDEYKEEVFRRSERRIKKRRIIRNHILMCCVPVCLVLLMVLPLTALPNHSGASAGLNGNNTASANNMADKPTVHDGLNIEVIPGANGTPSGNEGRLPDDSVGNAGNLTLDGFAFSLTWGCYGISSYDSTTGELVKTKEATNPEDYITYYYLNDAEKMRIYNLLMNLDVTSYPDIYNPQPDGVMSSPSMTLVLTVKTDTLNKTITASDIVMSYESQDSKGQKLLSACKSIQDILMATDEWKALPEYEIFYD